MDFNGLIAFLGLAVAVFTVMPKYKKLDLRLRLNRIDLGLLGSGFLVLLYLLYLPVLRELQLDFDLGPWLWGFNQEIFTNSVLVLLVVYFAIRLKTTKISRGNIDKANDLFEQLLFDKKYDELVELLDRHVEAIIRVQASDSIRNTLSKLLLPSLDVDQLFSRNTEPESKLFKLKSKLAMTLAHEDECCEVAEVLLLRLFKHEALIQRIAYNKPYLGIRIIQQDLNKWTKEEFITRYFCELIDDLSSIYYFELNHTQTLHGMSRYEISKSSKLLHYLFSNVTVAESLEIYRPVGEKVCDLLETNQALIKRYNEPLGRFYDVERQKCPIDNSLHFFNLMIIESLFQGVRWHMWLYYCDSFSKSIIGSMNPTKDVDFSLEWPTPFHYLLYQVVDHLIQWLDAVQYLEGDASNAKVKEEPKSDNSSIPQCSAICLGRVIWQIFDSGLITNEFKTGMLEKVLRFISGHQQIESMSRLCKLVENTVIQRGNNPKLDSNYLALLAELYHDVDHVITCETESFYNSLTAHLES
ncbi:hypothetical protein [uncultured Paraglaciecola sp.]|uniref:hypothetical protein n=1 Tax=uncultured Paraglaciecola sp. TaxID=1765024 RepID=UPI0030DCE894|tara:strand:+ start:2533 stop:4110 length:1578 start_codon:yes stop_codon:yes gene_type:complete